MTKWNVGRARLLKLAEHLRNGELGHKKFNFNQFNMVDDDKGELFDKKGCGSSGCAIGECPVLFPRFWKFSGPTDYDPILRDGSGGLYCGAGYFFGIGPELASDLFCPSWSVRPWNKNSIGDRATKKQVAASIERFVKWYNKTGGVTPEPVY